MSSELGVGSNPRNTYSPTPQEVDASAFVQTNKERLGIGVTDEIYRTLTQAGRELSPSNTPFYYKSSPERPLLDYPLFTIRSSSTERRQQETLDPNLRQQLESGLPGDIQLWLEAQRALPPEVRHPTFHVFTNFIDAVAAGMSMFQAFKLMQPSHPVTAASIENYQSVSLNIFSRSVDECTQTIGRMQTELLNLGPQYAGFDNLIATASALSERVQLAALAYNQQRGGSP